MTHNDPVWYFPPNKLNLGFKSRMVKDTINLRFYQISKNKVKRISPMKHMSFYFCYEPPIYKIKIQYSYSKLPLLEPKLKFTAF